MNLNNFFFKDELTKWEELYAYYVDNYEWNQIHVLRYENLKTNLKIELWDIMNFLGLKFDENVAACLMNQQTGSFKRHKKKIDLMQFFTTTQKIEIEKSKTLVYKKLGII